VDIFEITSGIRQNKEDAFNLFYQAYSGRLYRYLLTLAQGKEEVVRDVIQDVMIRVIRYIKPFQEEKIFWAWLTRLARTAFIDYLRRQRYQKKKTALCGMTVQSR
jgi:RNA polymerase sigma factor (sigma-70 family)